MWLNIIKPWSFLSKIIMLLKQKLQKRFLKETVQRNL